MGNESISPMMSRYLQTKEEYPDCILFYRLGDFYEMFFDDAITASKELELTLTGKNCGMEERAPMCGVPHHSANVYIERLIEKGYKVAVCEQTEDPKKAKGLVRREVVRVVTPGTVSDENMLDDKKNNFLCVIYKRKNYGLAFCDVSTGEVYASCANSPAEALNELARYQPREVISDADTAFEMGESVRMRFLCKCDVKDIDYFQSAFPDSHFGADTVSGLDAAPYGAVSGLLHYLMDTQKSSLEFIDRLTVYSLKDYMEMDMSTRRSLEICETMRDKSKPGSLLGVLDKTKTSMGARRLKQWLEKPLVNPIEITKRLYAVNELCSNTYLREEAAHILDGIYDISRILTRVSLGSVSPRDMASLRLSLSMMPALKDVMSGVSSALLTRMYDNFDTLQDIYELLCSALSENPPVGIKDGGLVNEGFSEEVDELREIVINTKEYIHAAEETQREKTGIKNLKIGYNKVFGYYIEVTKSNLENVPQEYIRKQTLVNGERFITPALKEMEEKILSASERLEGLESEIFEKLRQAVADASGRLKNLCEIISDTDALLSLAETAVKNNYIMPEIVQSGEIIIKDGRHPVVERMRRQAVFVPNDTILDGNDNRLLIITGPNMAGKSTYMRQTALIVLMAQIGSFVPASFAKISVVDKIFTRVGASDDISQGQSTFMLEMVEVSNILQNATRSSLIILDEIGRGTSTFDGLSIAWAVAEYVANRKKIGAKTLFATHYHELCALENTINGVKNYSISVKKRGDEIIFLRKIIQGGTDDSFGIEVAALAGVPKEVVKRAKEILAHIEQGDIKANLNTKQEEQAPQPQIGFADGAKEQLCGELARLDATTFTPIEALNKLYELSQRAKEIDL